VKALTLTEPWATLVAIGAKRIETRSWGTDYRGPIGIHAAKGMKTDHSESAMSPPFNAVLCAAGFGPQLSFTVKRSFPETRGCVIATAELAHCIRIRETGGPTRQSLSEKWGCNEHEMDFGDFTPGRFAWMLRNVVRLPEPIPATGALGLWDWTPPAELAAAS
jgi:hypothetical protein